MIHQSKTKASLISIEGAPPQNMHQVLRSFEIKDKKSLVELQEDLTLGRDIIITVDRFVITREFAPSKILSAGRHPKII